MLCAFVTRETKALKSVMRRRKEFRESIAARVDSELKYLEDNCLEDHARALEDILHGLTAHLDQSPARKKAFMARVAKLMTCFRDKRRNDETQGQAIMRASEIRRLGLVVIENHFLLQEVDWMRNRLQLRRLSQLLFKMAP